MARRPSAVASPGTRSLSATVWCRPCPICASFPRAELDRLRAADVDPDARLALLADACRLNALVAVKRAGSGHLGSTFSALDIVAQLLFEELNVAELGFDHPDRDVFFSSKGHDVPGLYAALHALGVLPRERLLRLRRLGGLDGHPDVARARDRGELRLTRDGHLQGARDRAREAAARTRGSRRRDDRGR